MSRSALFQSQEKPEYIINREHSPAWLEKALQNNVPDAAETAERMKSYPSGGGSASNLADCHIHPEQLIYHNAPVGVLYERALQDEPGRNVITSTGAIATTSGKKTGRSPKDKRIVEESTSKENVWWGPVNFPLKEHSFLSLRERSIDFLNSQRVLYVVDAFAGHCTDHRIKIRIICTRAYHALFMRNMLIRPTPEELKDFGDADFTIYNAGCFPANRFTDGVSSEASVCLNLKAMEMTILGTQYAGEMKKGVLTLMMYLGPLRGDLTLHSSATEDPRTGASTVFFGLSGTGKTTLSADPHRNLIGDDEHVWTKIGLYNIEGGCYAKCIDLNPKQEPDIFNAITYGAVLENVRMSDEGVVDYSDVALTENTRCSYPLEHIRNAKLPATCGHPSAIVLLTCDAFGVLPPVSLLTREQVMYQFISGYTAKMPGVEAGTGADPTATFSACFGGPFLVWHPVKYAELLAEKMLEHQCPAYLVNTGWTGGKALPKGQTGGGKRMSLPATRLIVDAINSGDIQKATMQTFPGFEFQIPTSLPGLEGDAAKCLNPIDTWADKADYKNMFNQLVDMFNKNFAKFSDKADKKLLESAPKHI